MGLARNSGKVLVIGLDGATFDLMKPWAAEGYLPTLAGLMEEGAHAPLRSVMQPISPQAWSSFLTGKNPGKHGVFGFTSERIEGKYSWRPCTSRTRRGAALWDILGSHKLRSGFFFVPLTYPPPAIDGVLIGGLGTPGPRSQFTYPPELKERLAATSGLERILEPAITGRTAVQYVRDLLESIEWQTQIVTTLMKAEDLDLTVVVYGQSDRAQHFFWKQMDDTYPGHDPNEPAETRGAIKAIYQKLDQAIAEFRQLVSPETTVIVMSDHGAGPYYRDFYLNNWLAQEGLLSYRQGTDLFTSNLVPRAGRNAVRWARRALPRQVRGYLRPIVQGGSLSGLWATMNSPDTLGIDWEHTKVYSVGAYGNLMLNQRGREPLGTVEPGSESTQLLAELTRKLLALEDPETGKPVVEAVYHPEDLFQGPYVDNAPDLLLQLRDGAYHVKPGSVAKSGDIFGLTNRFKSVPLDHSGIHRLYGVMLAYGPAIRNGTEMTDVEIIDLAPTILHLLGLPIPDDMDGKVLTEMLNAAYQASHPLHHVEAPSETISGEDQSDGYSAEEAAEIEERLKSLGYL
jgi:predicted AlkP superfamily phosphohydrolase/phosphomutase